MTVTPKIALKNFITLGDIFQTFQRIPAGFLLSSSSGVNSQFEITTHPLLLQHENVVLKRKLRIPSLEEPARRELTARFEWRPYVRRGGVGKRITHVGRRPRLNGVNAFTIEFDRLKFTESLRDALENDLVIFDYNQMGQISRITPSNSLKLPTMHITYDKFYLPIVVEWLGKRREFGYDQKQRLVNSSFETNRKVLLGLLKRTYYYGKDSSRSPSMVEITSG